MVTPHLFREQVLPGAGSAAVVPGTVYAACTPLRPNGYAVTCPVGSTTVAQMITALGLPGGTTIKNFDYIDRRDTFSDGSGSFET